LLAQLDLLHKGIAGTHAIVPHAFEAAFKVWFDLSWIQTFDVCELQ
jgi:hypothetical protein